MTAKADSLEWHPYAERFPLLEGDEWKAFKESIRATHGPELRVTYRLVNGKRQGLDGRNRYKACQELGLECPMEKLFIDDDQVKNYIIRRNVNRRHLSAELRKVLVEDLRAEGQSTRKIAETLGVSRTTVIEDIHTGKLAVQVDQSVPPENGKGPENSDIPTTPAKVVGRDGKSYAATKPAAAPPAPAAKPAIVETKATKAKRAAESRATEGGTADDDELAAEKQAAAAKKKNGKPIFDDRKIGSAYGALARLLNDRAQALGQHQSEGWLTVHAKLGELYQTWQKWQAEKR